MLPFFSIYLCLIKTKSPAGLADPYSLRSASSFSCSLMFALQVNSDCAWVIHPQIPLAMQKAPSQSHLFALVLWVRDAVLKCSGGQWAKLGPGHLPWTPHIWKWFPCEGGFPSGVKCSTVTCSSQVTAGKDAQTYICIHIWLIYVFWAAGKAQNMSSPLPGLFLPCGCLCFKWACVIFFTNLGLSGFSFLLWLEDFSDFC